MCIYPQYKNISLLSRALVFISLLKITMIVYIKYLTLNKTNSEKMKLFLAVRPIVRMAYFCLTHCSSQNFTFE